MSFLGEPPKWLCSFWFLFKQKGYQLQKVGPPKYTLLQMEHQGTHGRDPLLVFHVGKVRFVSRLNRFSWVDFHGPYKGSNTLSSQKKVRNRKQHGGLGKFKLVTRQNHLGAVEHHNKTNIPSAEFGKHSMCFSFNSLVKRSECHEEKKRSSTVSSSKLLSMLKW